MRAVHAAHRLTDHHCDLLAADVERLERTLRAPDPQSKEPADAFVDNDDDDDEEEAGEDLAEEKARRMRDAEKRAEMERVVARVMAVRGDMERRIAGMKVSDISSVLCSTTDENRKLPTTRSGAARTPRRPFRTCATRRSGWRSRTRASWRTTGGTAPR